MNNTLPFNITGYQLFASYCVSINIFQTVGVIIRGRKSIQLNVQLKQYSDLSDFKKVPNVVFPVLWFSEVRNNILTLTLY